MDNLEKNNMNVFTSIQDRSAMIASGFVKSKVAKTNDNDNIEKSVVHEHQRKSKSGKLSQVKEYEDKRQKHEDDNEIKKLRKFIDENHTDAFMNRSVTEARKRLNKLEGNEEIKKHSDNKDDNKKGVGDTYKKRNEYSNGGYDIANPKDSNSYVDINPNHNSQREKEYNKKKGKPEKWSMVHYHGSSGTDEKHYKGGFDSKEEAEKYARNYLNKYHNNK